MVGNWASLVGSLNTAALSAFGRGILYLPRAGAPALVRAIVQEGHRREETAPGVYALIFEQQSDLPVAPERGDEVEIGAARYAVFEIEADGEGGVTLALRQE